MLSCPSRSRQGTEGLVFCYDFLFSFSEPGDGSVGTIVAAAGFTEMMSSALFAARIPAPAPPAGGLGETEVGGPECPGALPVSPSSFKEQ